MIGKFTRLYIKIAVGFLMLLLILTASAWVSVMYAAAKFHDTAIPFWGDLYQEGKVTHQIGGLTGMIIPQGGPLINASYANACGVADHDLLLPVRLPLNGQAGIVEVLCPSFQVEQIEIELTTFALIHRALKGAEYQITDDDIINNLLREPGI